MPKTADSQTPQNCGDERVHQDGEAGWAAAAAIVYARYPRPIDKLERDDWPISGDDLALAKAGVIA